MIGSSFSDPPLGDGDPFHGYFTPPVFPAKSSLDVRGLRLDVGASQLIRKTSAEIV